MFSGVSHSKELLISESHSISAAVQPHLQTEESVGLCFQVSSVNKQACQSFLDF